MTRALVTSTVALGLLALACTSDDPNLSGTGGHAGATSSGGSGGTDASVTGTGGSGVGGSAGHGGGEEATIAEDSGGEGSSEGTMDGTTGDAAAEDVGAGDGNPGGDTLPGKPWIHLCEMGWDQQQCCEFLCSCLATNCADSPLDAPRIDGCMPMCLKLTDMEMRCHVYHCYESLNPNVTKDHESHCGHASGRVGGGGCPTAVYQ